MSNIDFNSEVKASGKDHHQLQLFKDCLLASLYKPNFGSILCYAFDNPIQYQESPNIPSNLVVQISKAIKLNQLQEICLAIILKNSSNEEIKRSSAEFLRQKIPEFCDSYSEITKELENTTDVSVDLVQNILIEIESFQSNSTNQKSDYVDLFSKLFNDNVPKVVQPYLNLKKSLNYKPNSTNENQETDSLISSVDNSIVDIIQELGYSFTSSKEDCQSTLLSLIDTNKPLDSLIVAKLLGMMTRTYNSVQDPNSNMHLGEGWNENKESIQLNNWNPDVFVQTVQDLVPNLSWKDVVRDLDHPEFFIKDKMALKFLVQALKKGLKDSFPVEYLYRVWKNPEGQLSWFIHSLKHPEIFCFTDYPSKKTATECLKAQPEEDNKLLSSWRLLNLLEILLSLSETGLYSNTIELFKFPITQCPDLLLLGLLQLTNVWNKMKQEIISVLIPIFLNNHPNSAVILQYAWNQTYNSQIIRTIIMNSMVDWYMKAQDDAQNIRLARILDVSQDLKALSILLNGQPLIFNIDLACLAARRGYLKLDKWLSDRIRDHGELFISTVVVFLKRKVPQLNSSLSKEDQLNQRPIIQMPLLPETVQTILKCISASSNGVSTELSQEIFQMNVQARLLLDKPNLTSQPQVPQLQPLVKPFVNNQGTYEMIQSMMNLNINTPSTQTPMSNFPNSPSKLLLSQLNNQGMNLPSAGMQANISNMGNQNMVMNNNMDPSKFNVLSSLLGNQAVRPLNYPTHQMRSSLNSPQLNTMNSGVENEMKEHGMYSKELEEEVEKFIQGIFKSSNPNMSVDEFVNILAKLKDSQDKKEKEFYNYSLKHIIEGNTNLFELEEMQFHTMSLLWGAIIDKNILLPNMLSNMLKLILQMLTKPVNSRFYVFAIKVIDRFKNRLKDLTSFCQCLIQMPNYQEFHKILREYIEYGARGLMPNFSGGQMPSLTPTPQPTQSLPFMNKFPVPNNPTQSGNLGTSGLSNLSAFANPNQNRNLPSKPSIANTTNIETLLVANENDMNSKPVPPSEAIQDKIGFIFNNLSLSNMTIKGDELKEAVKDDYWEWIAHYLVVKRVSIEPNFHSLYSQFVDTMKRETLNQLILAETYRNIRVLLRSDKNDQKFSDRALLKNLGSWLGLITLGKNRPILQNDIDLKSLIIEAFQKGPVELLFVVPFVAKVLEPAGRSKIFQPPNPWLMGMLSVLVELHNEPDLKLNHKFEIEVLCKNLSVNINDIPVKNILRNFEISEEQLNKPKDANAPMVPSGPSLAQLSRADSNFINPASSVLNPQLANQSVSTVQSQTNNAASTPADTVGDAVQNQVQLATAKYKITDIKLQSLQNNANLIYINPEITLLNVQPSLKNFIIPAMEKAVNEMMHLLLDKAVKISVSTAEPIIKKDFCLDSEENHMRIAARNMVANMSSGMMLITGKEPLTTHLFNSLKVQFTQPLTSEMALAYKDLINQACGVLVHDNIELCMCFLQKIAIQRSIIELERKLQGEFESRQRARTEGRAHYDPNVLSYHEKMPEQIRLRVGSINPQQYSVYEEFGRNLPGFKVNAEERVAQPNFQMVDEMNIHYENIINLLKNEVACMPNNHFLTSNLQNLMFALHEFKVTQQPTSALNLIKKLVTNLLEGYTLIQNESINPSADHFLSKYRESNLSVMKIILGDQRFYTGNWIVKEVQKIWLECNQDLKYSVEGIGALFKFKLLLPQTVDLHISQFVDAGNAKALQFALQLLKYFYIENANSHLDIQLSNTLESVSRIASISRYAQQSSELKDVVEVIRMNYENEESSALNRICATALSMMYTGVQQARDFDDPPGLKEKSGQLLHDWIQHQSLLPQKENTKAFQQFVLQMNTQGLFKTDDMITRFFRICTETCVETCYVFLGKGQRQACYQWLDSFVKLIILLVKHSGDQTNHVNKINLFNKVLGLIAGCLIYDQETKLNQFEPMPFHRLFHMLLLESTLPENNLEPIINHILQAFVNVFQIVKPTKAPGFAYSWLELVAHRLFISKMLQVSQPTQPDQTYKTWSMYATLLTQLVRFLAPFLRNIELTPSIMLLYKGTLRLFLVLLHDFPEFLCNSHYQFCDVIPSNCIQLRNLVLSAFPRSMKLPDPLTPNLKVDMIADIDSSPPKISYPYTYNIPFKLKNDLDSYIKTRSPVTFLSELRSYLQTSPETGSHYNIQLMNALVIYVGTNGILALRSKGLTPTHNNLQHASHSAHSDIFQSLVADLDSEGRYLFINAVANQLRYPNSHTHYFGCVLLNLFSEANTEAIQEQITRVLLERLIVNRPHPWGLLVTFIELIKNPQFKFWSHQFVHCAPEIEK